MLYLLKGAVRDGLRRQSAVSSHGSGIKYYNKLKTLVTRLPGCCAFAPNTFGAPVQYHDIDTSMVPFR